MSAATRAIVRLALWSLGIAALSGAWELLARQSPGTPLYLGQLPGPIMALRQTAMHLGVLLLGAGWLVQAALPQARQPGLLGVLHVGAALTLGAGFYAASTGLQGVQLLDPRPDAPPLFVVKYLGWALLAAGLLELGRRALRASRPPDPPPG